MPLTRPRFEQINSIVTTISDPITVLNKGSTLANIDVGFIFNRDGGASSNIALFWDESATSFVTALTTSAGSSDANITISEYANLITGNITANGNITTVGGYFVGNGYFLTGVVSGGGQADKILSGASNVTVTSNYVNVAINSSNIASFSSQGFSITGNLYLLGSPLAAIYGGTGQSSYTAGDLLYATNSTTLAKLPAGSANQVLQIHANAVPYWDDIDGGTY